MNVKYLNSEYTNISEKQYSDEKFKLQVELLKLQEWVVNKNKRIAIIFEGRDAAGKGSTIKRFIEHLIPKHFRVHELGMPSEDQNTYWLKTHENALPIEGEIVFFDRSWYSRAMIQPTMGYCSKNQYKYFMANVNDWENKLIQEGLILIKFYLSVNKPTQRMRFHIREHHQLKYWKLSKNDLKTLKKWEEYTFYKNQMFEKTSTENSPWVIINSNDKMVSRLNAMRYVLNEIQYDGKKKLAKTEWEMDFDGNNLTLFGVHFDDLNQNQYALLSKMKQLEITKKIID